MFWKLAALALGVGLGALALTLAGNVVSLAQPSSPGRCPLWLDPASGVRLQVVDVQFVEEIDGVDGNALRVPREKSGFARIALVTVRVQKAPNQKLTIAAADFSLHYNHAGGYEVHPCEGISFFSTAKEGERPMILPGVPGPGSVKTSTGPNATRAQEVYFDAAFWVFGSSVRNMWLCIGQPVSQEPCWADSWSSAPA